MSIQEHLNKIRNAIKGSEVRESIAKGIETAYDDASEKDNANMEVKMARGTHPTLRDRLNEVDDNQQQTTTQLAQTTLKTKGVINASQFDDLQTALNSAVSENKRLDIADTYNIDRLEYIGDGTEHIEIFGISKQSLITSALPSTSLDKHIINIENVKSLKIDGLQVVYTGDLDSTDQHSLIKVNNTNRVVTNDLHLSGANKSGLELKNCDDVKINGGVYTKNYHCGIEYGNVNTISVDNITASENGVTGDHSTGYGIAQATGTTPSKIIQLSNIIANDNTRKGVDCHEFGILQANNITTLRNGISGFSVQTVNYDATAIQINNLYSGEQVLSDYTSESGLDINVMSPRTIGSIELNNIHIENVPSYGIILSANGASSLKINATINNVFNGYSNGNVLRLKESEIYPNIVDIDIICDGGNTKGVLIECANKLKVTGVIKRPGASLLLHFPTKDGDPEKVRHAKIHDLILEGASDYFVNGYTLTGGDGVITDNRHTGYTYENITVINGNIGESFPLWRLVRGLKYIEGVPLSPSVPNTGTWSVGDKFIDTDNLSSGYIGRVCTVSGTPGTWKNYGSLEV